MGCTLIKKCEEIKIKKNTYNKLYFVKENGKELESKYLESYLLDEHYYMEFRECENIAYFLMVKLDEKSETGNVYEVINFLRNKLKEYGMIAISSYLENDLSMRFQKVLKYKFKTATYEDDEISITFIKGD